MAKTGDGLIEGDQLAGTAKAFAECESAPQKDPAWFRLGQFGNPGDRPKGIEDVQTAARRHSTEAIETLAALMRNAGVSPQARVAAARELLDRGWGKPAQPTDHAGSLTLEQLIMESCRPDNVT